MSKKARDYLLILFAVLFVFITIITSLYASGYKFNLSWPIKFNRLLQKTGMLAVATKPTHAVVYLNDQPQKDLSLNPWKTDYITTPAKIKNILPGEYELRFEENGYWPYKQKINIYSGETAFVEDVNLFRENSPLLIATSSETDLIISPDNKYIYAPSIKKIITLKNEAARDLTLQGSAQGVWLENNRLFSNGIIFDPLKETNDNNYASYIGSRVTNWNYEESTERLYYQNKNSINRFDINNKNNTSIISGANYLAFKPKQEKLFVISNADNQIKLSAYSLKTYLAESEWIMPNSGHYSFVNDIPNQLAVYDDQNKTLYLFNEIAINSGPIVIRNIKNWTMFDDQSLIYSNDYEIYLFHFSNSQSDLITRRSEVINKLLWNSTGNYLIFTSSNSINVLDFKNRNATTLFKADRVALPAIDLKNKNLYFWAKLDNESGIYKMIMQ